MCLREGTKKNNQTGLTFQIPELTVCIISSDGQHQFIHDRRHLRVVSPLYVQVGCGLESSSHIACGKLRPVTMDLSDWRNVPEGKYRT